MVESRFICRWEAIVRNVDGRMRKYQRNVLNHIGEALDMDLETERMDDMKLKLIYQIGKNQALEYFSSPVDLEYRYFQLSKERHDEPSGIKIPEQLFGVIQSAYYRLDSDWLHNREQGICRMFLWAKTAREFIHQPNEFQIRAVGKFIGSGKTIGELCGFTDREWRYVVSGERKMSFSRWRLLLEFAGLVHGNSEPRKAGQS